MQPNTTAAIPAPAAPDASAPTFNEDPKLTAFREAAKLHPNDPAPLFQLGWALYDKQRYTESLSILDHVIGLLPDGRVYDLRGAARMASDTSSAGLSAAASDFSLAIRQYPNWFQPHEDLGKAYAVLGRWSEAASELEKSIALTPDQRHDYYDLLKAYKHTGQTAKAEAASAKFAMVNREVGRLHDLENVCSREPNNADAFLELALLHLKNGNYTIATQILHHAVSIHPNNAHLQSALHKAEAAWKHSDLTAFGAGGGKLGI